jgi:hypothetical protein
LIAIDNKLVSDALVEEQFICDLKKCKGGCCVDGDAGAPLEVEEKEMLAAVYESVKPYLPVSHIKEIEKQGLYVYDREFGWVTPAINGGICVYAIKDNDGIVKCGIEKAYYDGKFKGEAAGWKKPISCHLFPVRIKKSEDGETEYVNYEPREDICKPGCKLGKKMKLPVYQFLKEPLIRKYGEEFYEALDAVAKDYFQVLDNS